MVPASLSSDRPGSTAIPTPVGPLFASTATPEAMLQGLLNTANQAQNWEQAVRLSEVLLNRNPDSVSYKQDLYEAHLALGRAERSRGALDLARRDCSIAQQFDPEGKDARDALAALDLAQTPTPHPTPSPTSIIVREPSPTSPPVPAATSTAVARTLYVRNTGGDGVSLRGSPAGSRGQAWPDGAAMKAFGTPVVVAGASWQQVRAPDGAEGWVPNQYLVPSPARTS
jgi:hypothetical protein